MKVISDLYVEDFCIMAKELHNIASKVVPIECRHWSCGRYSERFWNGYRYLVKKYARAQNTYTSTACTQYYIGKKLFLMFGLK